MFKWIKQFPGKQNWSNLNSFQHRQSQKNGIRFFFGTEEVCKIIVISSIFLGKIKATEKSNIKERSFSRTF